MNLPETFKVVLVQRTVFVENVISVEVDSETVVFLRNKGLQAIRFPVPNVICYEALCPTPQ